MSEKTMPMGEAIRHKAAHLEIEHLRKRWSRLPWIFVFILTSIVLCLFLVLFVQVAKSPPVVVIDPTGKPVFYEETDAQERPLDHIRVRHFAEHFLKRFEGVRSGVVLDDWEESMAMCSFAYQEILGADQEELKRRDEFLNVKDIRTVWRDLKTEVAKFDPKNPKAKIKVRIQGRRAYAHKKIDSLEGVKWEYFVSYLSIHRVPLRKIQPYGLAVDFTHTRFFPTPQELNAFLLERAQQ